MPARTVASRIETGRTTKSTQASSPTALKSREASVSVSMSAETTRNTLDTRMMLIESLKRVSSAMLARPALPTTKPMTVTANSPASCSISFAIANTPKTTATSIGAFWYSGTLPCRNIQLRP